MAMQIKLIVVVVGRQVGKVKTPSIFRSVLANKVGEFRSSQTNWDTAI